MNKFNLGDIVYFIANGYHIREATIIRTGSGFCTIKFNDNEHDISIVSASSIKNTKTNFIALSINYFIWNDNVI